MIISRVCRIAVRPAVLRVAAAAPARMAAFSVGRVARSAADADSHEDFKPKRKSPTTPQEDVLASIEAVSAPCGQPGGAVIPSRRRSSLRPSCSS
jgi:hypothetical protein